MNKLKFSPMKDNKKLSYIKGGYIFSLPAGKTCPGADKCKAHVQVNKDGRKLIDGKNQIFRCFSASSELIYPSLYRLRDHNFKTLKKCKTVDEYVELLLGSLPKTTIIRIHDSGDFFNENYLKAWLKVAEIKPEILFYAYTKSVHFVKDKKIPKNFRLTLSYGGKYDHLIEETNIKSVKTVFSEQEAKETGLKLDKDDSSAYKGKKSFALLLHGGQKSGSIASKALSEIRRK